MKMGVVVDRKVDKVGRQANISPFFSFDVFISNELAPNIWGHSSIKYIDSIN